MGTAFGPGDIIEGEYNGQPYRFTVTGESQQGSGSYYGPGYDEILKKKVFLKKYIDPAQRSPWFSDFIAYQGKVWSRINVSRQAQQVIAGIHLYFQHSNDRGRFWQAIEYVENSKDLKAYLASAETTWEQRVKFASVFMYAMKILHNDVRLVHGDLKPGNLLLIPDDKGNYRIKLIDFDRPLLVDEDNIPWAKDGYLGSPGYFSPEHLAQVRPSEKSDVFTCGLILYELLSVNGHPYNQESDLETYKAFTAPVPTLIASFGSEKKDREVSEMLHRMLDPEIGNRPTADEVHKCLISSAGGKTKTPNKKKEPSPFLPPLSAVPVEKKPGSADIVFLLDATASMKPCISALKEHIHQFIHDMVKGDAANGIAPVEDWRARIVGYRDFLDCSKSQKVAKLYNKLGGGGWFIDRPFTRKEAVLHEQLDKLTAFGGGKDPAESLLDAMMLVMKAGRLPPGTSDPGTDEENTCWRGAGVGKVLIVFTDAGYHHEMSYDCEKTLFSEKEKYPLDLTGAGLDEMENEIESGHYKIYVFAPEIPDYEDLSELSNVNILPNDEGPDSGLVKTVADKSKFSNLLKDIIKGVSRSASDCLDIPLN